MLKVRKPILSACCIIHFTGVELSDVTPNVISLCTSFNTNTERGTRCICSFQIQMSSQSGAHRYQTAAFMCLRPAWKSNFKSTYAALQRLYCMARMGPVWPITGANERERSLSTEIQSVKMIEIGILLPFYQGCKKGKRKKINDHFHRLQWESWSDNRALQWACSVMRAGINTWHIHAGVCPAVGQQSSGN